MTKIIALSGAQGFIGKRLSEVLCDSGYEVWPLVRKKSGGFRRTKEIFYDCEHGVIDEKALKKCHAVIHLAGKNIMAGPWTKKFKEELWRSRVMPTKLIAEALARFGEEGPRTLICASAVGYYGATGKTTVDEKSPRGEGFLAELCEAWEDACEPARKARVRVANMRFAVVLAGDGGMLKGLSRLFKMGLGFIAGSGQHYQAMVGREDVVRAILFVLKDEKIAGPVNVVCPEAITNEEFSKKLAALLAKNVWLRIPESLLNKLGEQAKTLLVSCRVKPRVLVDAGFCFEQPSVPGVLEQIYHK